MPRAASATRLAIRDYKASLKFSGLTTERVNIDTAFLQSNILAAVTVSAWVYLDSFSGSELVAKRAGSGTFLCFRLVQVNSTGRKFRFTVDNVNPTSVSATGTTKITLRKWYHVVGRYDGANVSVWVDGVKEDEQPQTGNIRQDDNQFNIGVLAATATAIDGLINEVGIWGVALTDDQIKTLCFGGDLPSSGLLAYYKLNEGAGANAIDSSGNGNTGTISGAVANVGTSLKLRKQYNANGAKNGDFEYVPPFTAGTTTASRWIDGTAAGSSTNDLFGWFLSANWTGTDGTASFDTSTFYSGLASLKINKTSATGGAAGGAVALGTPVFPTSATQQKYFIPVVPGREYQLTCRLKTDSISNSNTAGARIRALLYDGLNTTSVSSASSSYVRGTNDWQLITVTFTPGATVNFVNIWCQLDNETGTAWFDEVSLVPTTPLVRTQAAVRAASA